MNDKTPQTIRPSEYRPPSTAVSPRKPRRWTRYWVLGVAALLGITAIGFFSLSKSVRVQIDPKPDSLKVSGGIGIAVGDGHLLLPGDYRFTARAQGYSPLEGTFAVGPEREQSVSFKMQRLPGYLTIISDPPGAEVFIDDVRRGQTPLEALELETGEHQLVLRAKRYQAHAATLDVEGGGIAQAVNVKLEPGWAAVKLRSQPEGAEILVDDRSAGSTPATLELGGGPHTLQLRLSGYQTWTDEIQVQANQPLDLGLIKLQTAQGKLELRSTPGGAAVSVDGQYRGRTPLTLALAPGRSHRIRLSAAGHRAATRDLNLGAELTEQLHVRLDPILGSVRLAIEPADARVRIDGKEIKAGTKQVTLTTSPHRIEVSKAGYATQTVTVKPRESVEQTVRVKLSDNAQAASEGLAPTARSKTGIEFVLVKPGGFTMGSRRGTQGRQSNEPQRRIRLTRPFYLSAREITNAQFRQFRRTHSSGIFKRQTLDNENQPVVRVSWEDAVAFCNWLSRQDGLEPAYVPGDKGMVLSSPKTTGYRLPTETEWEWAARFAQGRDLRYPWGDAMPPAPGSGNYAGSETDGLVARSLDGYSDGVVTSASVGRYPANAIGLFDIGGNVSEWTHDRYAGLPSFGNQEEIDPLGPEHGNGHVVRGASWMHGSLVQLRLAYRGFHSGTRPDLGFRVARYAR